jgi:hypothetical protein
MGMGQTKGVHLCWQFVDAAYTIAKLRVRLQPVKGVKLALRYSRDLPSARQDL